MTTPHSQPVVPAQPKQDYYSFSELALFKAYTRETFRAAFGVQAPPYDPARVIKTWFDSTVDTTDPNNVALYKVISRDQRGQWGVRQMVLAASEAASVNLPGSVMYPDYSIAPTKANRAGTPVWPDSMSLESEARALLQELGLPELALNDEGRGSIMPVEYGDDPRRVWDFVFKSVSYNVGAMLNNKNRNGVGAPGRWAVSDKIEWIADPPAPTGLDDPRSPRDLPVRDLLQNEKIVTTLMGASIGRTDRMPPLTDAGGQFTEADRSMLRDILRLVSPQ